jgi:LPS-assembly lipoprotein
MSIKNKTLFAVLLALALTGCGFEPMYGSYAPSATGQGSPESALSQVSIGNIPDAEGVYLRNLLIDRFYQNGYPSNPRYSLSFTKIQQSRSDLDITIESEATRRLLTVITIMKLTDTTTQQPVLDRTFKVVNSYDVIGSQFSTRIAEQDALEAALNDIARQVELQITLFLNRGGQPSAAPALTTSAPIPNPPNVSPMAPAPTGL